MRSLSELEGEIEREEARIKETKRERRQLMRKMQRLIKEAIKKYPGQVTSALAYARGFHVGAPLHSGEVRRSPGA